MNHGLRSGWYERAGWNEKAGCGVHPAFSSVIILVGGWHLSYCGLHYGVAAAQDVDGRLQLLQFVARATVLQQRAVHVVDIDGCVRIGEDGVYAGKSVDHAFRREVGTVDGRHGYHAC